MSHVFISYSHANSDFAYWLAESLQDRGYAIWLDYISSLGGRAWENEISKGIEHCTYFVLAATPDAETSKYIGTEIRLAKKFARPIIPLLLGGNLKKMGQGEDVSASQGIVDFTDNHQEGLEKLIASLTDLTPARPQLDLLDKVEEGQIKFQNFGRAVRSRLEFGPQTNAAVGLLYQRTPFRAASYLVGQAEDTLTRPVTAQVFLQFSGDLNDSRFESYLHYMRAHSHHKRLWTILVRGPFLKEGPDRGRYKLPQNKPIIWQEAINFTWDSINQLKGTVRHVELYLNTPNAFVAGLMSDRKIMFQLDVFHFNDGNPPDEQLYSCVYHSHEV